MAKQPEGELSTYRGHLDGVVDDTLHGWAYNQADPFERVELDLVANGKVWHRVTASLPREDLQAAGYSDGAHAFQVPLSYLALPGEEPVRYVNAYVVAGRREISASPWVAREADADGVIGVYRVDAMNVRDSIQRLRGKSVDYLLLDTNNLCNADCVYCPHPRGPELMELSHFEELVDRSLASVKLLQIGCGQEPTADRRLGEFLRIAHRASSAPRKLQLITNGTLLDRHDPRIFQDCKLDSLMLSIDTIDANLNARLRAGTDLRRMLKNLDSFRASCPGTKIHFSVVVTSETVDGIGDLIEYGRSIGVAGYFFREVTSYLTVTDRPRRADFEEWMAKLRLPAGRFDRFAADVGQLGIDGRYLLLPAQALQERHSQHKYLEKR